MDADELWELTGHHYDSAEERYAHERYPQHIYRHRRETEMLDLAVDTLRAEGRTDLAMLDIGCGYGDLVAAAAARGVAARGIDASATMVELARERLTARGADPASVTVGSALELDAPDASLDIVAAIQIFGYLDRSLEDRYLGECARVLRPGGFLITAEANALFDIATFNKFTVRFFRDHLLPATFAGEELDRMTDAVAGLVTNPAQPPAPAPIPDGATYVDALLDGEGTRYSSHREQAGSKAENPLDYPRLLGRFGFTLADLAFYHFHATPPLLFRDAPELERRAEPLEDELTRSWQGYLMASSFVAAARKLTPA